MIKHILVGLFVLFCVIPAHVVAQDTSTDANGGKGKILYYRNPMGLPDVSPEPKKDSMGMDYIPVYENEVNNDDHSVQVSPGKVQKLGVRTERAEFRLVLRTIRAVGIVKPDEARQIAVTTRYEGWIEDLFVNQTGQDVGEGDPLVTIYSPDVTLAEQEYVLALRQKLSPGIVAAAKEKLELLGVEKSEIERLTKGGKPGRTVTLMAPMKGQVLDKMVIEGTRIPAGEMLYRIVDLSQVWVIADVYEQDIGLLKTGQQVTLRFTAYPGEAIGGRIDFIYPTLSPETRTGKIRVVLANPDGRFRTDMYANVEIMAPASGAPEVSVPNSAILDSGKHQIVLVEKGEGRYEPREIEIGHRTGEYTEILSGLEEGEKVVVSANFLIDAESNLQSALKAFTKSETSPAEVQSPDSTAPATAPTVQP